MPQDLNELEAAVLALPPEQRGHMAKRLLWSLEDAVETTVSPESESAWAEMAERRYQAYLAGEVRAVPADEAIARLRRRATPLRSSELEAAVLALPSEQRGDLAERLIASLDDESDLEDPEVVERAWLEEIKRRQQRLLAGKTKLVPAAEAIARARAGVRRVPDNGAEGCDSDETEEVQRAWVEEAERRYQEYLAGGVEVIPASEALAQVRAELTRP
jgi:hypothetical protein